MTKRRPTAAPHKAARNFEQAARNLQDGAALAVGASKVVALRSHKGPDSIEAVRMVGEKVIAAQGVGIALLGTMMARGPVLAAAVMSLALPGKALAGWQALAVLSLETTSTMLLAQRAMMAPLSVAVRSNLVRLGRSEG